MRAPSAYWAAFLAGLLASQAVASEPKSQQGDVGKTSYTSLPFQSQVYDLCFNCSPELEPAELFLDANPQSPFRDPAKMAQTREDVAGKEKQGSKWPAH